MKTNTEKILDLISELQRSSNRYQSGLIDAESFALFVKHDSADILAMATAMVDA